MIYYKGEEFGVALDRINRWIDEYCRRGFEGQLLPLIRGEKRPVRGVKFEMRLPSVMADDGRTKMTRERLLQYYREDPFCNLGLLTGERSGIVAIDFDRPKSGDPKELKRFREVIGLVRRSEPLPGIGPTDTTCYLTPRGAHLLYKRPCALKGIGVPLSELGLPVDVMGDGGYVVVPPSQTGDRKRVFLRGLEFLKKLPTDSEVVRMTRRDRENTGLEPTSEIHWPKFDVKDHLCIYEILDHDIPDGRRNHTLLVLFSLLILAGNRRDYALKIVRKFNRYRCKPPLSKGELRKCTKKRYNYGCLGIRQTLSWLDLPCANCKRAARAEKKLSLLHPLWIEKLVRAGLLPANIAAFLLLQTGQAISVSEAAKRLGVSDSGIHKHIRHFKEAGIPYPNYRETDRGSEPWVHSAQKRTTEPTVHSNEPGVHQRRQGS